MEFYKPKKSRRDVYLTFQTHEFFRHWSVVTWRILQNIRNFQATMEGMLRSCFHLNIFEIFFRLLIKPFFFAHFSSKQRSKTFGLQISCIPSTSYSKVRKADYQCISFYILGWNCKANNVEIFFVIARSLLVCDMEVVRIFHMWVF